MADAETNWIDFYISLAPVAQTAIWAGVAVAVLLILRKPLRQLGDEIVRRMQMGDTFISPILTIESRDRKVAEQVTKDVLAQIKTPDADVDALLKEVGTRFIDLIFPATDFATLRREDTKTSLYVTDWEIVSDFLNDAYNAAVESGVEVPMWTYGRYWHFKNERTGEYLEKSRQGGRLDDRPFEDLGVAPGDTLVAERIR
ncbi:MAG: hypothetical protein AAFP13_05950 [Pseudomonadota bacterium]